MIGNWTRLFQIRRGDIFLWTSKSVSAKRAEVACVGWNKSQKRWSLLLVQYVESEVHGPSAFRFPTPQQAALVSVNPAKKEKWLNQNRKKNPICEICKLNMISWNYDGKLDEIICHLIPLNFYFLTISLFHWNWAW